MKTNFFIKQGVKSNADLLKFLLDSPYGGVLEKTYRFILKVQAEDQLSMYEHNIKKNPLISQEYIKDSCKQILKDLDVNKSLYQMAKFGAHTVTFFCFNIPDQLKYATIDQGKTEEEMRMIRKALKYAKLTHQAFMNRKEDIFSHYLIMEHPDYNFTKLIIGIDEDDWVDKFPCIEDWVTSLEFADKHDIYKVRLDEIEMKWTILSEPPHNEWILKPTFNEEPQPQTN